MARKKATDFRPEFPALLDESLRQAGNDEDAAKAAWTHTLGFFDRHLP